MKKKEQFAISFIAIVVLVAAVLRIKMHFFTPDGYIFNGSRLIKVLYADTYGRQYKGLGGQKDLNGYEGMFFQFGLVGDLGVVMRDMHFPIDIVWLNNGEVVDIKKNLRPEPEKSEPQLTKYFNVRPADSFLELKEGGVDWLGIKIGDKLQFCEKAEDCGFIEEKP